MTETSSSRQSFSKDLFWTGSDARRSYKWKITEWYLLFIVCFRPGSYFHARNNRPTVDVIVASNFLKTFILGRQWCKGSYKWKITEWYLLFIVSFVQDPIFKRETIGRLWRHRHVKLLQNIYFGQAVKQGFYNWKITEWYLLFIVSSVQDPIFTRETIGWLWRVIFTSNFFKTFILDRNWCKGFYKWKIIEWYLLFIVCSDQDPIVHARETIEWLRRVIVKSIFFKRFILDR